MSHQVESEIEKLGDSKLQTLDDLIAQTETQTVETGEFTGQLEELQYGILPEESIAQSTGMMFTSLKMDPNIELTKGESYEQNVDSIQLSELLCGSRDVDDQLFLHRLTPDDKLEIYYPEVSEDDSTTPTTVTVENLTKLNTVQTVYTHKDSQDTPFDTISNKQLDFREFHKQNTTKNVLWFDNDLLVELYPKLFGKVVTTDGDTVWVQLEQEDIEFYREESPQTVQITDENVTLKRNRPVSEQLEELFTSNLTITAFVSGLISAAAVISQSSSLGYKILTVSFFALILFAILSMLYEGGVDKTTSITLDRKNPTFVSNSVDFSSLQQRREEEDYLLVTLDDVTENTITLVDTETDNTITREYDQTLDDNDLQFFKTLRDRNPNSETFALKATKTEPETDEYIAVQESEHTYDNYNTFYLQPTTL
jgi:hypothetical protein